MEPLSPNDPLLALLRKAGSVESRPNFTQNVMRAVRQTPQPRGLAGRVASWLEGFTLPRVALTGAVALLGLGLVVALQKPVPEVIVAAAVEPVAQAVPHLPAVVDDMLFSATEGSSANDPGAAPDFSLMDPMGLLLVHEDTTTLTDSELALLVY